MGFSKVATKPTLWPTMACPEESRPEVSWKLSTLHPGAGGAAAAAIAARPRAKKYEEDLKGCPLSQTSSHANLIRRRRSREDDLERARRAGRRVEVRVARLISGHRAHSGAEYPHRRARDPARARGAELDREARGGARVERKIVGADVRRPELRERDPLAGLHDRELLVDDLGREIVLGARLMRREGAAPGPFDVHGRPVHGASAPRA